MGKFVPNIQTGAYKDDRGAWPHSRDLLGTKLLRPQRKPLACKMRDLQIPKRRLELSKRSFSYVGAKVWNDIPNAIRNVESIHLFNHKIKTHLLGQSIQK